MLAAISRALVNADGVLRAWSTAAWQKWGCRPGRCATRACPPDPRLGQPPAVLRISREVLPDSLLKHRWSAVTGGLDGDRGTEVAPGAR